MLFQERKTIAIARNPDARKDTVNVSQTEKFVISNAIVLGAKTAHRQVIYLKST